MNTIALVIGWVVMVASGIGVTLFACYVLADYWFRWWCHRRGAMSMADIFQAIEEWKANHPGKRKNKEHKDAR